MKKITLISLLSLLIITGCQNTKPVDNTTCSLKDQYACSTTGETISSLDTAKAILQSLKDKDMDTLSTFISEEGVRLSPYSNVNTGNDIIIKDIKSDYNNTGIVLRGVYDGSGEPINLNTQDYFNKFVYDVDYLTKSEIVENNITQRGNIINNISDIYPNTYTIEFYISGFDPQYEGMDRKSLTLVLKQKDNKRYLIGIIHGQWTI